MSRTLKEPTSCRSIRMNARTISRLMAASRYFCCPPGTLISLLLDATRLSAIKNSNIPDEIVSNFYKEVQGYADTETYLFKD